MNKQYLGDGVYIQLGEYGGIKLTTEDGRLTTNRICLEPEVIEALLVYIQEFKKQVIT